LELKKPVLAASASMMLMPVPKSAVEMVACGTPSNTAKKSFSESERRSSAVDFPKRMLLAAIAVQMIANSVTAFIAA
jgi:hypothetical protein